MKDTLPKVTNENQRRMRSVLGKDLADFALRQRKLESISVVSSSEGAPRTRRQLDSLQQKLQKEIDS